MKVLINYKDNDNTLYHQTIRMTIPEQWLSSSTKKKQATINDLLNQFITPYNDKYRAIITKHQLDINDVHLAILQQQQQQDPTENDNDSTNNMIYIPFQSNETVKNCICDHTVLYIRHNHNQYDTPHSSLVQLEEKPPLSSSSLPEQSQQKRTELLSLQQQPQLLSEDNNNVDNRSFSSSSNHHRRRSSLFRRIMTESSLSSVPAPSVVTALPKTTTDIPEVAAAAGASHPVLTNSPTINDKSSTNNIHINTKDVVTTNTAALDVSSPLTLSPTSTIDSTNSYAPVDGFDNNTKKENDNIIKGTASIDKITAGNYVKRLFQRKSKASSATTTEGFLPKSSSDNTDTEMSLVLLSSSTSNIPTGEEHRECVEVDNDLHHDELFKKSNSSISSSSSSCYTIQTESTMNYPIKADNNDNKKLSLLPFMKQKINNNRDNNIFQKAKLAAMKAKQKRRVRFGSSKNNIQLNSTNPNNNSYTLNNMESSLGDINNASMTLDGIIEEDEDIDEEDVDDIFNDGDDNHNTDNISSFNNIKFDNRTEKNAYYQQGVDNGIKSLTNESIIQPPRQSENNIIVQNHNDETQVYYTDDDNYNEYEGKETPLSPTSLAAIEQRLSKLDDKLLNLIKNKEQQKQQNEEEEQQRNVAMPIDDNSSSNNNNQHNKTTKKALSLVSIGVDDDIKTTAPIKDNSDPKKDYNAMISSNHKKIGTEDGVHLSDVDIGNKLDEMLLTHLQKKKKKNIVVYNTNSNNNKKTHRYNNSNSSVQSENSQSTDDCTRSSSRSGWSTIHTDGHSKKKKNKKYYREQDDDDDDDEDDDDEESNDSEEYDEENNSIVNLIRKFSRRNTKSKYDITVLQQQQQRQATAADGTTRSIILSPSRKLKKLNDLSPRQQQSSMDHIEGDKDVVIQLRDSLISLGIGINIDLFDDVIDDMTHDIKMVKHYEEENRNDINNHDIDYDGARNNDDHDDEIMNQAIIRNNIITMLHTSFTAVLESYHQQAMIRRQQSQKPVSRAQSNIETISMNVATEERREPPSSSISLPSYKRNTIQDNSSMNVSKQQNHRQQQQQQQKLIDEQNIKSPQNKVKVNPYYYYPTKRNISGEKNRIGASTFLVDDQDTYTAGATTVSPYGIVYDRRNDESRHDGSVTTDNDDYYTTNSTTVGGLTKSTTTPSRYHRNNNDDTSSQSVSTTSVIRSLLCHVERYIKTK